MYCAKCGTKLNEQGICTKCNGLHAPKTKSVGKLILLVSVIGFMASVLCGLFVWNLTENEIYHKLPEKSDFRVFYGMDGYSTVEHNFGATICIVLLDILITVGIDVFICIKSRNR